MRTSTMMKVVNLNFYQFTHNINLLVFVVTIIPTSIVSLIDLTFERIINPRKVWSDIFVLNTSFVIAMTLALYESN